MVEMGMVDHLGCLAVLLRAGGRPDMAHTMLVFRNNIILACDLAALDLRGVVMERFGLILGEMELVRSSFEEASACLPTRN